LWTFHPFYTLVELRKIFFTEQVATEEYPLVIVTKLNCVMIAIPSVKEVNTSVQFASHAAMHSPLSELAML